MHKFHRELLGEIKKHAGKGTNYSANDSYLSSGHEYYSIAVPIKRTIAKEWAKNHKNIGDEEFLLLLNSLYAGDSYEEKTMASLLLGYLPKQRMQINPAMLDEWLGVLTGWAEIDSLSQPNFTAKEMLGNWEVWKNLLRQFSKDKNISKRRAALVLLTGSVSYSDDKELAKLAFELVERLQGEKDILITKAISWLLRSLIKNHRNKVVFYINANELFLPKIAVRETRRKLLTGRK